MSNFKDYINMANEMINETKKSEKQKIKKYTEEGHKKLDKETAKQNAIKFDFSISKLFSSKNENEFFINSNKYIDHSNKENAEEEIKKFLNKENHNIKIEDHRVKPDRAMKEYVYKVTLSKKPVF